MSLSGLKTNVLRTRAEGQHARVEFIELFFDLVFVFAITQVSHALLHHLTPVGAFEAGFLLLAVWWVWMYTTWVTNWVDPLRVPVRFMLFALMAAGLVLSSSIPEAFASRALPFALAYVFMQVGRSLFMVWATRRHDERRYRNFFAISSWMLFSAVFWIAGALAPHALLIPLWCVALAIEYLGPIVRYWLPGRGAVDVASWDVDPHHMAERCGLFIIIVLGESILVTGATFAKLEWTLPIAAAMAAALATAITMWWIYFSVGQAIATMRFAKSGNVGKLARQAYTYFHLPIVAGIVLVAAGDELVLNHATGHADLATLLTVVGGPALFLAGNTLFKAAFYGRPPLSHLAGIGVLAVLGLAGAPLSPLALTLATTLILIGIAIWEHVSLKDMRAGLAGAH